METKNKNTKPNKATSFILIPLAIVFFSSCGNTIDMTATNSLIGQRLFLKVINEVQIQGLKGAHNYYLRDSNNEEYHYDKDCGCFPILGKEGRTNFDLIKKSSGKLIQTYRFEVDHLPFPKISLLGVEQNAT